MPSRDTNVHTGHPRTRTEIATEWCVWHVGELTGVALPTVLAATVNGWFGLLSGLVAAGWAANEVRLARARNQITAERQRRALTAVGADDTDTTENAAAEGVGQAGTGEKGASA
ncbi:hypothetical protein [Prauserella muralis]|uniref:Uncharacterized protein n=1 Tax=Prauserella muralis TaxID=588067 RepID=A0A2V4BA24_9PSEU|nr:hypothetical protein [Prauserella muralis]PXY32110.1 hypothetical protein BAY60_07375 [Prauserella muralis]TWE24241.1 hypothetical protein FHX69_5554 [Prauserella muralis]